MKWYLINCHFMPPNLGDHIKLSQAPKHFQVSTKTLRRRRDQARKTDDSSVLEHFIVVTKDGEIYPRPTAETVKKLVKEGRQPDWLVRHDWVRNEFGSRGGAQPVDGQSNEDAQPEDSPKVQPNIDEEVLTSIMSNLSPEVQFIIRSFETQLREAKELLEKDHDERADMRTKHQETIEKITRLLPESTTGAPKKPEGQGTVQTKPVDTTPKVQAVRVTPKKASASTKKKPAKKKRGTVRDFLFGTKE